MEINKKINIKKLKEALSLLGGLGLVVLLMFITDIGCPIKTLTGISCAGCGMTRAVFCAVRLQFAKAFYYHPLFWMCPVILVLYLFWNRISPRVRKAIFGIIIASFCITYILRLFFLENDIVVMDVQAGWIAGLVQKIYHLIHATA